MKPFVPILLVLVAGFGGVLVLSQPVITNAPAATPKLSAQQIARYASLSRRQLELEAQSRLLRDMAQEHTRRGEEAAKERLAERAAWERDLGAELSKKSNDLLKQSNDVAQERVTFEEQSQALETLLPGGLSPDENAYLSRLDEHLVEVQQELAVLAAGADQYNAELQTNTTADDIGRISDLLQENARQARELQKTQAELELKKLEFRAIRR